MTYSARSLGKQFGLNDQQMNMALKLLGYLEGEPGCYSPTEKGKQFFRENYHDNGYGGYCKRIWSTISYDESIIVQLKQEVTKDICKQAINMVKECRAAKMAENTELLSAKLNPTAETIKAKCSLRLDSKDVKHICIAAVVTSAIIVTVVLCVKKHKKKKSKEKLTAA